MAIPYLIPLSPILGWSWPALVPILIAVGGALGYRTATKPKGRGRVLNRLEKKLMELRIVEIPLEEHIRDIVSEQLGYEQEMVFEKDDIVLMFGQDARGKFRIRVMGPTKRTLAELRMAGDEFARELIQQFAYNRIAAELDRRGVQVVEETVDEEGNIVLSTRRW
jgi:hypothetical protein